MRSRIKTRRSQRNATGPVSYRAVPLPRFRREVIALLMAGRPSSHPRRLNSTQALRLVIRWDRVVRLRYRQGKPPCNVADHILKYERQGAVCPCGNPLPSPLHQSPARDKDRGACRRCSRLVERDPKGFQKTIYRKCPCGETAHGFSGRRNERELEYTCRNCRRVIVHKPEYLKPLTRKEWDRKEARKKGRDPERHNHDPHKRLMWCPNTRCVTAQPGWAEKGQTKCEWCKVTLRPVKGRCKACDENRSRR